VVTIALNMLALWHQEGRQRRAKPTGQAEPSFSEAWQRFRHADHALRRLVGVGLGTMAFGMQDVLLEPYGGQILGLTVGSTTKLTATMAIGGLMGFGLASRILSRGADPFRMASIGAFVGIPAFFAVIVSAPLHLPVLFGMGAWAIGFGSGLFAHGTLTATMNLALKEQVGLALGAWGAVQATCAGASVAIGGILHDIVAAMAARGALPATLTSPAAPYTLVYSLEVLLLLATLFAMTPLIRTEVRMAPIEAR
jgi:BCD family chlorophyll transporter-like MFS transporter